MLKAVKELRERAAEIATEARTLLDTVTDDMDAGKVAEVEGRFDEMMADHDRLVGQAEREQRLYDAEQRGMPAASADSEGDDVIEGREQGAAATPEYREVFTKALRFGVSALSGAEQEVLRAHRADVPEELRAQSTGTDSAGGFTVPTEFSGEIDRAMAFWGPMWDANIVRELNTSNGRRIDWPTIDDTGKTGRIKAENAAADDDGTDDAVFGEKQLDAFVYDTGIVKIPMELLQDSAFDLESLMNDLFGERLGRLANTVLTTGTGSSQPQGIVTASAAGTTAAANNAITSDELIDLEHSVDPAYRASPMCRWQFADSTLAAIRKLKDGQGNYLWQLGDIRNGEPATILGHPYSVNQAMPAIATGNRAVLFGDHSKFVVRKVMGFQVLTLRERYAERFQVGMVGFKRFDSELLNSAAVKHLVLA